MYYKKKKKKKLTPQFAFKYLGLRFLKITHVIEDIVVTLPKFSNSQNLSRMSLESSFDGKARWCISLLATR